MVDITGLDKAEVLYALYNASHVQGLGFLQAVDNYTLEDARRDYEVSDDKWFDYLHGRILKVNLSEDSFRSTLYNRDNGEGAAEAVIAKLRAKSSK